LELNEAYQIKHTERIHELKLLIKQEHKFEIQAKSEFNEAIKTNNKNKIIELINQGFNIQEWILMNNILFIIQMNETNMLNLLFDNDIIILCYNEKILKYVLINNNMISRTILDSIFKNSLNCLDCQKFLENYKQSINNTHIENE
jgi:hypothetical protein